MSTRYDPVHASGPTLSSLDSRLQRVEQLLIKLDASMTPKWVRLTGYGTAFGAVLGALLKAWGK
jgi:hypothetical protein